MARYNSKNSIPLVGVILLLLSLLLYLGWLNIPGLSRYAFWIAVLACGVLFAVSRKNSIRIAGALILLIGVLMYLGWLAIPGLTPYAYWLAVLAFGVLLLGNR